MILANCAEASPPTNGYGFPFYANHESIFFFGCHQKFHLPANYPNQSTCVNGKWEPEIPRACLEAGAPSIETPSTSTFISLGCNPLLGSTFTTDNCQSRGMPKDCRLPLPIGSQVTSTCRPAYDGRPPTVHTCQSNGVWSPAPIGCNAICGQTSLPSYMPWHVMFTHTGDKFVYYDGVGTIVSDRIVVGFGRAKNESASKWKINVGLMDYSRFDGAQTRNVIERIVIDRPGDTREATFALYVTDKPFSFDVNRVAPICLDYSVFSSDSSPAVLTGMSGMVITHRIRSYTFELYPYTIINNAECMSKDANTNHYLQQQLELGAFCSHQTESNLKDDNCAILRDSGLAMAKIQNGKMIFYLRGIANEGHHYDHRCNWDDYQTFINVIYFLIDIKKYIDKYKVI